MADVAHPDAEPAAVTFPEVPDTLAVLAWAFKDQLIKRLDAEIASEADDTAALLHEARQERAAVVMADLVAVERDEAGLTFKAWAEGVAVEPRPDLDPIAMLNVELVLVKLRARMCCRGQVRCMRGTSLAGGDEQWRSPCQAQAALGCVFGMARDPIARSGMRALAAVICWTSPPRPDQAKTSRWMR